ncbi:MAG: hypothetical protein WAN50_04495 [Minisyncoccia bacterium]
MPRRKNVPPALLLAVCLAACGSGGSSVTPNDVPPPATGQPTSLPTLSATALPTSNPTTSPTTAPPTSPPTVKPTSIPTIAPTVKPTTKPTTAPTSKPTTAPTVSPTTGPVTYQPGPPDYPVSSSADPPQLDMSQLSSLQTAAFQSSPVSASENAFAARHATLMAEQDLKRNPESSRRMMQAVPVVTATDDHESLGTQGLPNGSGLTLNGFQAELSACYPDQGCLSFPSNLTSEEQGFMPTFKPPGSPLEVSMYYSSGVGGASKTAALTVFDFSAGPAFIANVPIDEAFFAKYVRKTPSNSVPHVVVFIGTVDAVPSSTNSNWYAVLYDFSTKSYEIIASTGTPHVPSTLVNGWAIDELYAGTGSCPFTATSIHNYEYHDSSFGWESWTSTVSGIGWNVSTSMFLSGNAGNTPCMGTAGSIQMLLSDFGSMQYVSYP